MRMFKSQRGAELSEIVAGLLVVLVAGVAAASVMFNGLDTAAGKVATWLGGLTIPRRNGHGTVAREARNQLRICFLTPDP